MRVLLITNYYPPSNYGWGYMQLCEEVADGLAARGHEITVLTSTQRDGEEISRPYPVHRLLTIEPDWHNDTPAAWQFFVGRRRREKQAVAHLLELVAQCKPQIIFVWHTLGLPRVLFQAAEQCTECATVYYLADYAVELRDEYLAYWQARPVRPLAKAFKAPLARLALCQLRREGKPLPLRYPHVVCVSEYVRQRLVSQGLIPSDAVVIHNGVDLSVFSPRDRKSRDFDSSDLRCLIAGRVTAEKGIHTVIEALTLLGPQAGISLTILGDGPADYADLLRRKVQAYQLQNIVKFEPPIPRAKMPEKLADYDVLILPSEYAEPIARAMQEAMAMRLLVIGTVTGGSGELLVHKQTGLVFEAGNPQSLATELVQVINQPELIVELAENGYQAVREHFNMQRMVRQVERYLLDLASARLESV